MNTRSIHIIACILTIVVMVTSCSEEDTTAFTDSPVIEAYIEPGNSFVVQVSRQTLPD